MHRCRDILEEILPTRVTRHLWTIPVELPLPFFTLCSTWKKSYAQTLQGLICATFGTREIQDYDWFLTLQRISKMKILYLSFLKHTWCFIKIWILWRKRRKKSGKFVCILAGFKQCRYHPSIWRIFLPKFFKMLRILQSNEDTPSIWRIFLTISKN